MNGMARMMGMGMMGKMKGPMIEHMETMDENMKELIGLNKQILEELRKLNKSKYNKGNE